MNNKYLKVVYVFWSKIYDNFLDKLFSFDRKAIIKELNINKSEKILEVGIGTGLNLAYYPRYCTVFGIDISKQMLEKAKQKNIKAKIVLTKMDASNLDFKDNLFDKALATYVLRVVANPYKVMQEVSRVVKNNGCFVILDQFKEENKLWLKLFQSFKLLLGWGKEYEISDLIKNTSWKVVKKKQIGKMKGTKVIVLKNFKVKF